uniref:ODAD1 central coiled coil region domain-containing protein n=1 Tax=Pyramimonas obovata TaxID=1411642 RepID=A0A7S0WSW4_9CHLO|mmetsp:Transcript_37274/g.81159  ORF Transcript_37274/g.81159 Transcript_37274/m.81159 type:complete len:554 (+) Transcript_37274:434-2095(+)|eukprot:CAMPEP_0118922684 /NCGR_PEP_ID=MMETSP1169-20130426/1530_1 /TAXON_ID=36882 /ORGANISM="Pyramimonas obovata, Strain CCMP722" /LENGTH=553 /DNA_ID=CAMNT_0006863599 /DNA_START=414 /DNA_END=2075 /DNA_ORIENTATION=+
MTQRRDSARKSLAGAASLSPTKRGAGTPSKSTTSLRDSALGTLSEEALKLKEEVLAQAIPANANARSQIAVLQEQADNYTRKIELERRRVAELDMKIEETKHKILEQRKRVGGVNAARENHKKIVQQTKVLEGRLQLALQKYNDAVLHNRTLKEQINDLRKERMAFDAIYKKLEKDLNDKKREMAQIIEVSNKAYEARDAAVNEMARLKNQADREHQAFEAEWRDLGKLIDMDRKRRDTNKQKRTVQSSHYKEHRENSLEEEAKLRKKVIKGNWNIAKDRAQQQVSMEKVQSYGEAFAKIQQATGITDIDELVDKFMHAEDENFRLFKYVDELNQEIANFEEQIAELIREIEEQRAKQTQQSQRKHIITDLESRLRETEARTAQHERKYQTAIKTVGAFKEGIVNIYNKLIGGGEEGPATVGEDLNSDNIMRCLGVIEQKTNEILQMYAASQSHVKGGEVHASAALTVLGQGPQIPAGKGEMHIDPPSTVEEEPESSEDEDATPDDRPLSMSELQGRASKNISKRAENADKKKRGKLLKQGMIEPTGPGEAPM